MNDEEILEFIKGLRSYCSDPEAGDCVGDCNKCDYYAVSIKNLSASLMEYFKPEKE